MKTLTRIKKVGGIVPNRDEILYWFNSILDRMPDGEHLVEINPTNRTEAQNKYYWVCMRILSKGLDIPQSVLHENIKSRWLPEEEYLVVVKRKKKESTSELDKDEMTELLEKVIAFAADQHINIPDPKPIMQ